MPDETPPTRPGGALFRSAAREAFEASDAGEIDAVENHLELAGGQLAAGGVRRGVGEVIASGFEALAPQAQTMPAPVEDFEAVGQAVAEDEEVTREGVGVEAVAHESKETVKAEAHIDRIGAIPELNTTALRFLRGEMGRSYAVTHWGRLFTCLSGHCGDPAKPRRFGDFPTRS